MTFSQELKKLNKQQRLAVEAIEGPVMVVAGPGTGKTQILTLRIANILEKTDTSPESILALTFTESAASEMRQRLLAIMGPEAHRVSIKTIHGFCNELIQDHPLLFPMIAGEHSISEVEQIQIIRNLLETSRQRFSRDILSSISELKREGLTPKDISEYEELSKLYAAYEAELRRAGRYDYDDMITSVAHVLTKNRDLRLTLREQYLYILVDEHQDTNKSQNSIIELLAGDDQPNLFVVGDGQQAIYRFQGAEIENFSYFKKRFKTAHVIALTENYRSTQTILDSALSLTESSVRLKAYAGHREKPIIIAACENSEIEPYVIARHIKERIKKGAKAHQIAVLSRTHKESALVESWLRRLDIPVAMASGGDAFSDQGVRSLITLFSAIDSFGSDDALIPALYLTCASIKPFDITILIDTAHRERRSVFSLIRDREILKKITPESADSIFKMYQQLSLWRAMSKNFSLLPMLAEIIRFTGFIQAGAALFKECGALIARRRSTTLSDFLNHLDVMRSHGLPLPLAPRTSGNFSAVELMTAHKAKGLEFDYVYIVGATARQWEERRSRNVFRVIKKGRDEVGERNLFYVALTRARKEVVISYAKKNIDGKAQLPSFFIETIRPELKKGLSVARFAEEYKEHPEILFKEPRPAHAKEEREFMRKKFLERGLSASALNNYRECPSKFYFLNLVGLPEAPHSQAQAGNAAHAALKFVVAGITHGKTVTKKQFLAYFQMLLARESMREIDYQRMNKKGVEVLAAYFDAHHKDWNKDMRCEYAIESRIGKVPIRGRLDRIDILTDGTVRVIDYKFKKPMTRNEIAGLTKSSDGNYYHQLTFYKLLIEQGTQWRMKEARLDFLEPDSKGRFKSEVFAPSSKEVEALKGEIKRVSHEILKMEFLGKKCGNKECKYCLLGPTI